ncbi:hypothetical protein ACRTEU_24665, partial [Vibrio alginolyticus]
DVYKRQLLLIAVYLKKKLTLTAHTKHFFIIGLFNSACLLYTSDAADELGRCWCGGGAGGLGGGGGGGG